MAKARRKRKKYSASDRASVLAAAKKEGLTAAQVQKKFGVTPVTYYSWRKKSGLAGRRGRAVRVKPIGGGDLNAQVRTEVRSKVQQILPEIVRGEVNSYLSSLFGNAGRGRRRYRV